MYDRRSRLKIVPGLHSIDAFGKMAGGLALHCGTMPNSPVLTIKNAYSYEVE